MGNNEKNKQSNLPVLIIGSLGYHTDNIINPIVNAIVRRNVPVVRTSGLMDFFIPKNKDEVLDAVREGVVSSLHNFRSLFFVDFFNFLVPVYNYIKSIEQQEIKTFALWHGSTALPNDVANMINHAALYENFLYDFYDGVILPNKSLKPYIPAKAQTLYIPFPTDLQFSRPTPDYKYKDRVVFGHRFNEDKGKTKFLEFVRFLRDKGHADTEVIVFDAPQDVDESLNIHFKGRVSQLEMARHCTGGGYAWSSVKSETFSYTMLDLLSFGLTPLANEHPAYNYLPKRFIYGNDIKAAYDLFLAKKTMTLNEWDIIKSKIGRGANKIAEVLLR